MTDISPDVREIMDQEAFTEGERIRRMETVNDCQFDLEHRTNSHQDWKKRIREDCRKRAENEQKRLEREDFARYLQDSPPSKDACIALTPMQLKDYNWNRYYMMLLRVQRSKLLDPALQHRRQQLAKEKADEVRKVEERAPNTQEDSALEAGEEQCEEQALREGNASISADATGDER